MKDADGQLIGSLNKSDFTVYDNGVKQDIAVFDRETEQPFSVAMLVDTSASTGIELHYELDSVSKFFRVLLGEGNPDDTVALYSFNWEVTAHQQLHATLRRAGSELETAQIRRRHLAL